MLEPPLFNSNLLFIMKNNAISLLGALCLLASPLDLLGFSDKNTPKTVLSENCVLVVNIWTGAVSTDWADPDNWLDGEAPTAADDVEIPNEANDPVISAAAVAKSVWVQAGASLTINAATSLTINGSSSASGLSIAFFNEGTVGNSGSLVIGSASASGEYGLANAATFTNNTGASIAVDRTTAIALWVSGGSFTNSGSIALGSAASIGSNGIINEAVFSNSASGTITINRTADGALTNDISGTFTNAGGITIGNSAITGGIGVENRNLFNHNGGTLAISKTGDKALLNTSGTFTNNSTLNIGAASGSVGPTGLWNDANFTNNSTLNINRSSLAALYNSGTFTNAATINIGVSSAIGQYGLHNQGAFNNSTGGTINLNRSLEAALWNNLGTFTNSAAISIGATVNVANLCLKNEDTFINNGTITAANGTASNQNGAFKGTGTFSGVPFLNESTASIAPGNSAGCLAFSSGLTSLSTINIEIGGLSACTQHDKINVTGTADINGSTLDATLVGNPSFTNGNAVTVLSATSRTGTFATVSLPPNWFVNYTPTAVILSYGAVLPIELARFTARPAGLNARLDWTTFSESDNRGFDVERSADGVDFEKIGFAAGHGTTVEEHSYLFFDKKPLSGRGFYRLRQVDFNGESGLSPVVSVEMGRGHGFETFPNPVTTGERVNLTFSQVEPDEPIGLCLFDAAGRLVLQRELAAGAGFIETKGMAPGIYRLEAQTAREAFRRALVLN